MTAAMDITKEQRKTLLALLRRFIPGVEVWAYGSRVKWTARPNSDLDLVAFTTPEQQPLVSELKEALAESDLPFLVDFHVWNDVPERFHEIIRKEYVVFQEAEKKRLGGDVATEWETLTLDELGRIVTGKTPLTSNADNFGNDVPFVTPSDMDERKVISSTMRYLTEVGVASVKGSRIPAGSVMVSCIGSDMGKTAIAGRDCVTNQQINSIVVDGRFSNEFVFYNLSTRKAELQHLASGGSTLPILNKGDFAKIQITLPPLTEQKAIAHILGTLDDKIELNRRMNATLETLAQTLFQSWFVDFDPVRAKLDGRKPAGLDAATAALFPAHFQESPLGHIPQGWEVKTIEELAERVAMGPFGSDIKVSTFVPDGIPVISGQHLRGTLLDDSEFNFVTEEHADRLKRSNVQRGDVIFTHAGSIGQVAYIPETSRFERYIISQRQFYMRCNRSVMSPFYIASYFKTLEGQHRLLANTSSTGVPSISQPVTYLRQLKMVVPPPALLKVFDASVSAIHLKMAQNDQQSRTLATLRDTMLPKLLSGELRVTEFQELSVTADQ
jgi:type I restriction enzyme S subunit